jgi:hypothetical protein
MASPSLPAVVAHHAVSEADHQLLRAVRVHITDDQILSQQPAFNLRFTYCFRYKLVCIRIRILVLDPAPDPRTDLTFLTTNFH